jgi:polyhydroxybutyrate depolymerase
MLDALSAEFGIDASRVYVTGLSNGAIFTERLGCELADRIAGIAPVAGSMPPGEAANCHPSRPIPVLLMHGTDDPVVPYAGGEVGGSVGGTVLSAPQTFDVWTQIDGCSGQPVTGQLPDRAHDGTQVQTQTFSSCSGGTAVALYTIQGGGHTWPGGEQSAPVGVIGRTTQQFDATEVAWQFFTGATSARFSPVDRN